MREETYRAKRIFYAILFLGVGFPQCFGEVANSCIGSLPVSKFRFLLEAAKGGPPLPVNRVNVIERGEKLKYEPLFLSPEVTGKATIAVVLVPSPEESSKDLAVLEAKPAKAAAEWEVPLRASVVGMIFGPRGLDVKKLNSLVEKNRDLIPQLADYAHETATVEALVQTLTQYEQSSPGSRDLNAVLRGFSTQYGVSLPKLDTAAPTSQQASLLLRAVLPSLSSYDPLAAQRSALVQQSTGLAASVAGLFFGNPMALAAGGTSLFQNMRALMFPDTNFLSAFALPMKSQGMELCTKTQATKSRGRPAYLWMLRIPDSGPPSVSLPETAHLPLGWKSTIKVACAKVAQLRMLPRARDWQLVSKDHEASIPVTVAVESSDDSLSLDLSQAKIPAGQYRLVAKWDWDPMEVAGSIDVRPFGNFMAVKLTPSSADRLVEGSGPVEVELTGADFEFVRKLTVAKADHLKLTPKELSYTLPEREGAEGPSSLKTEIDTTALPSGSYLLAMTQTNGSTGDVDITIHPPNPTIDNLPLRANLGETQQTIRLRGTGLERIERISSAGATLELAPVPPGSHDLRERKASIKFLPLAHRGDRLSVLLLVAGIQSPLQIPDAIEVLSPRPRIVGLKKSSPQEGDVALREGEIPAGSANSFAIRTRDIDSHPAVELACSDANDARQALTLRPGDRDGPAELDFAGEDVLFLSFVPGAIGQSGCLLTVTVTSETTGSSDPYVLGRVIRLPRIEKFELTDQKLGGSLYAGVLTGQDLQMIEKTGWNAKTGFPVEAIPVPLSKDSREQTLKVELPWPSPSPHAPLFVWLQGETESRMTNARF